MFKTLINNCNKEILNYKHNYNVSKQNDLNV